MEVQVARDRELGLENQGIGDRGTDRRGTADQWT